MKNRVGTYVGSTYTGIQHRLRLKGWVFSGENIQINVDDFVRNVSEPGLGEVYKRKNYRTHHLHVFHNSGSYRPE